MKIIAGMSVAKRLAVGFGLVAALLATVCAIGIANAWQSQRLIEETLGPAQARFNSAADLLSQVQRHDVAIRNIGLFSDPEAMQRQAALIKTLDAQVLGTLQQLAASAVDPQDRTDIETVQLIAKQTAPHYAKAIALALAFQPEDAVKILTSHIEAPSAQRATLLTGFAERQRVHVLEAAASIAASGKTAGRLIAVSGVFGLIVAAICGWCRPCPPAF